MRVCRVIVVLILSMVLCSCAGKQQQASSPEQQEYAGVSRIEGVSIETVRNEPKVASGYENIILNPIQMSSQFTTDYPDTASQFLGSIISHLKDKKMYKHVAENDANGLHYNGKTLIADIRVIDMRIVSSGARIWAGAMAGASYMDVYLKLTDAASKKVILEKVLATHNNAFASTWALGSENALPVDMGKIVGEYLCTVVPTT
ncbi:MAG: DUF4410 domain-containing protein [Proteobacteria bacterium]|nr:DUF4410 domain-containing protein [Pseudomonadota bacterium]MBU4296432.1 DUF4410 domain-containing protein [Pseudomonadota bacterium]MCG2748701.1 DUF4410 domain-containing protein [Desulfobulbaceae bacterium]